MVILIVGGMGPIAGAELQMRLTQKDESSQSDSEYSDIIHLSFPSQLTDRTEFLLGNANSNPGEEAAHLVNPILDYISSISQDFKIIIPCATFHSDKILNEFILKTGLNSKQKIVNLVEIGSKKAVEATTKPKVGVISTIGSQLSNVWKNELEKFGKTQANLSQEFQEELHQAIYDKNYGLKAISSGTDKAIAQIGKALKSFQNNGIDTVILGCTEFSLVSHKLQNYGVEIIDPMDEISNEIIKLKS